MKIRPLAWYSHPDEEHTGVVVEPSKVVYSATSLNGSFYVSTRWRRYHLELIAWDGPNSDLGWFDTIEDAKSAAFDDHKRSVMTIVKRWVDTES